MTISTKSKQIIYKWVANITQIFMLLLVMLAANIASVFAGHGEAPAVALDPAADVADVYAFRSWQNPDNIIIILATFPGQAPGNGPIYFNFDDSVRYRIHIDNDRDAKADDVVYEIRFQSEHRPVFDKLTFSEPYVGHPNIQSVPELQGITALDGPGSEGITFRQTYTVREIKSERRRKLFRDQMLVAVPSNIGETTMPDYEMLASQGIYADTHRGIKVFAGPRGDTFYSDSGALFDSADLRRFPPVLNDAEEENDAVNPYGINRNAGFNISAIVLEIPIRRLTKDRRGADTTSYPYLGIYASASREAFSRWRYLDNDNHWHSKKERQISRMGNPMVNTLIIDTPQKDKFNRSRPHLDAQFQDFFASPSLTRAPASEIFGIPVPPPPRNDLIQLFLKYPGQELRQNLCNSPCADLLRLNVSVAPTPPQKQKRMGILGGDPAGFPNGRRPNDDVTDFVVRSIGGPALIQLRVSDGVNFANGVIGAGFADGPGYGSIDSNRLDVTNNGIAVEFPFMPTPHDGKNHVHDH